MEVARFVSLPLKLKNIDGINAEMRFIPSIDGVEMGLDYVCRKHTNRDAKKAGSTALERLDRPLHVALR